MIDRDSDTVAVAAWAISQGFPCEIVGAWVWIKFPARPTDAQRAALKATGFRWNHKRALWQHPCQARSRGSSADSNAIRLKYGSAVISD